MKGLFIDGGKELEKRDWEGIDKKSTMIRKESQKKKKKKIKRMKRARN